MWSGVYRMARLTFGIAESMVLGSIQPEKRFQRYGGTIHHSEKDVQHKVDKVSIVEVTNRVEHPGTIVIEVQNKILGDMIVVTPRWLG